MQTHQTLPRLVCLAKIVNRIKLLDHQKEALRKLRTGSILLGGVGSGKSFTGLSYFYSKVCGGSLGGEYLEPGYISKSKDLYIITTARKRDSLDWERDAAIFSISNKRENSIGNILLTVDSWNNVKKYEDIKDAFFIFDEQKAIGSGVWAKSFVKISKNNNWIMLTATPGDTWLDYIPVFLANGFYKNRTEFVREHVIFNPFTKYPKVESYRNEEKLKRLKNLILVIMRFERKTVRYHKDIIVPFDKEKMKRIVKDRWNIFKNKPIRDGGEVCYAMRRVSNSDPARLEVVKELIEKHRKVIIFYNFDYELELLRTLDSYDYDVAEYNGHLHEDIPRSNKWVYLVQYVSAAEAWNCIETNAIIFYSQNYSFKIMEQAAGRIDRMNTPFRNLYYYHLRSEAPIDNGILEAIKTKTKFNEVRFLRDNKIDF